MNSRLKDIFFTLLRWTLGAVFVYSGLVKCVDPVGTSVFVEKYLMTYGLESLMPLAITIAISLATLELALGIALVVNMLHRATLRVSLLFISVFTVITLLSATVLPIGDCGCFGDAVKLSPWATFFKNILLLIVVGVLIAFDHKAYKSRTAQFVVVALGFVAALGGNLYALRHQPLVDFLPYKEGLNIRSAILDERAKAADSMMLLFVDKTTGEERLFASMDADCWLDDNLEYVDVRQMEVADAKYSDFAVYDAEGNDISAELLERDGRMAWLCVASLDAITAERREGIERLFAAYPTEAIVVMCAADRERVGEMLGVDSYTVDAMTLRSMMRSKVGVIIINDGVVELKADIRDI